jgi:hypothetical protein
MQGRLASKSAWHKEKTAVLTQKLSIGAGFRALRCIFLLSCDNCATTVRRLRNIDNASESERKRSSPAKNERGMVA